MMENINMFEFYANPLHIHREKRQFPEHKVSEPEPEPELPETKVELPAHIQSFQSKIQVYSELKSKQLKFLEHEAKRWLKKNKDSRPTKAYLQSYVEQMREQVSNHEWATIISTRKSTSYETEKTKIDILFP